jgi:hypothetical protein
MMNINTNPRMRILKNKIGMRELKRYVFSRQMHFLAQQRKGKECAYKSLQYITDTYTNIISEITVEGSDLKIQRLLADLWALSATVKV